VKGAIVAFFKRQLVPLLYPFTVIHEWWVWPPKGHRCCYLCRWVL